jgi:hypothetical protein
MCINVRRLSSRLVHCWKPCVDSQVMERSCFKGTSYLITILEAGFDKEGRGGAISHQPSAVASSIRTNNKEKRHQSTRRLATMMMRSSRGCDDGGEKALVGRSTTPLVKKVAAGILLLYVSASKTIAFAFAPPQLQSPSSLRSFTSTKSIIYAATIDDASSFTSAGAKRQIGNDSFLNQDLMARGLNGPGRKNVEQLDVAIVGAGLAGMVAAMDLADAGHTVTLYETRPFVGGKVSSWQDKNGNHIEMGLHVFFGCYYNLFGIMKRTGGFDTQLRIKEHTHTLSTRVDNSAVSIFGFQLARPCQAYKLFSKRNNCPPVIRSRMRSDWAPHRL